MMNYTYNQPTNPLDEIKRFFRQGSALSVIILVNVAIWFLVQALRVILFFFNVNDEHAAGTLVTHALALPASLTLLVLRPWTLVTYMFLHIEFWHILFNMLWLYWFGRIFLEFLSSRMLVWTYFLGGIAGGLVYILAFNIFPVFAGILPAAFALGASASVMAIVTAVSFYVPGYTIQLMLIGRIRILYMAIFLFVFDFFMIPSGNAGGHLAHIGGALFGFTFVQLYRFSSKSLSGRNPFSFLRFFSSMKRQKTTGHTPDYSARPVSDEDYNLKKRENQKRIDEILEKISRGGYDSLTKDEKEFLFKTSTKR
ncbi:MAG: rhomboid family intramembrane serine protease [Bacteroidota bacterium]